MLAAECHPAPSPHPVLERLIPQRMGPPLKEHIPAQRCTAINIMHHGGGAGKERPQPWKRWCLAAEIRVTSLSEEGYLSERRGAENLPVGTTPGSTRGRREGEKERRGGGGGGQQRRSSLLSRARHGSEGWDAYLMDASRGWVTLAYILTITTTTPLELAFAWMEELQKRGLKGATRGDYWCGVRRGSGVGRFHGQMKRFVVRRSLRSDKDDDDDSDDDSTLSFLPRPHVQWLWSWSGRVRLCIHLQSHHHRNCMTERGSAHLPVFPVRGPPYSLFPMASHDASWFLLLPRSSRRWSSTLSGSAEPAPWHAQRRSSPPPGPPGPPGRVKAASTRAWIASEHSMGISHSPRQCGNDRRLDVANPRDGESSPIAETPESRKATFPDPSLGANGDGWWAGSVRPSRPSACRIEIEIEIEIALAPAPAAAQPQPQPPSKHSSHHQMRQLKTEQNIKILIFPMVLPLIDSHVTPYLYPADFSSPAFIISNEATTGKSWVNTTHYLHLNFVLLQNPRQESTRGDEGDEGDEGGWASSMDVDNI
ncbi:hypothetical protein B7494_g2497 [Chlorociboria aeruginascens]|nr:hypothetical protein B7494_g2497 [Chlorociboria aeruginascens]